MLVELTTFDGKSVVFNPIAIAAASETTYKNAPATVLFVHGGTSDDAFFVKEDFATVRQRWSDALGN